MARVVGIRYKARDGNANTANDPTARMTDAVCIALRDNDLEIDNCT
jgi:hypothetical protein